MRMPLPQFSALLPSGFHTTISGPSSCMRTSRMPSDPMPKLGSHTAWARAGVMGTGQSDDSVTT